MCPKLLLHNLNLDFLVPFAKELNVKRRSQTTHDDNACKFTGTAEKVNPTIQIQKETLNRVQTVYSHLVAWIHCHSNKIQYFFLTTNSVFVALLWSESSHVDLHVFSNEPGHIRYRLFLTACSLCGLICILQKTFFSN